MFLVNYRKWLLSILGIILVVGVLGGCSSNGEKNASTKDSQSSHTKQGGVLKTAIQADPETLDWMSTSDSLARNVSWHIFEPLFGLDKDFKVRPMLAQNYKVSKDGKRYTIHLRKNVKFHDGSIMKAEDVVASLKRWRRPAISSIGSDTFKHIRDIKAIDDNAVQIDLKDVYKPLMSNLAAVKEPMVVIPAKIANKAGDNKLKNDQLIGTGPYKFKEWKRGQEITLTRFKDYASRDENWGGLAGKKTAYLDEIQFNVVKDPQVMLDGLNTGEYNYISKVPKDLYQTIKGKGDIKPETFMDGYLTLMLNQSRPPFNDVRMRKAVNYALDKKAIAKAVYGDPKFYELDGSLFFPEQKSLYTKEGTEGYSAYNPKKAKQLLKEAGYHGKPIRLIAASDHDDHYKMAQVAAQQLKEVGFNVKIEGLEWATLLERNQHKNDWEIMAQGWSTRFSPTELTMLSLNNYNSGWYKSDKWQSLLNQWVQTSDPSKQKELLAKMNKTVYQEMPFIKIVDRTQLDVNSAKVQGFESFIGQNFWNTWLSSK